MAARIVNLADPDEGETLCATVEDAEQALAAMVEKFKSQGYRVADNILPTQITRSMRYMITATRG